MNAFTRRTARGLATGLGALALVAGASACGGLDGLTGGGDEPTAVEESADATDESTAESTDDAGTEDAGTEDGATDDATDEATDDATDEATDDATDEATDDTAAGEPLSEEDLTLAGDRFYVFLEGIAQVDPEKACSVVLDYETGEPATGDGLQACIDSFGEVEDEIDPETAALLDRSMIDTVDNGDGRAEVTFMGESGDMYMVKASDGQWYIQADSSF
ncbi:hypothetical protein [Brachybacterium aquaticum]|uniref:Uncharacterized protein n=1 Tax=Brachybacterium aquaticum TaxID=1432564 RepID=A0A841ABN6_9MICO|nr:hypothetical protein [Brachybacterium aquaticum]MBB5831357.1 hypothetical protein [Brachybacterium aquaticum]